MNNCARAIWSSDYCKKRPIWCNSYSEVLVWMLKTNISKVIKCLSPHYYSWNKFEFSVARRRIIPSDLWCKRKKWSVTLTCVTGSYCVFMTSGKNEYWCSIQQFRLHRGDNSIINECPFLSFSVILSPPWAFCLPELTPSVWLQVLSTTNFA